MKLSELLILLQSKSIEGDPDVRFENNLPIESTIISPEGIILSSEDTEGYYFEKYTISTCRDCIHEDDGFCKALGDFSSSNHYGIRDDCPQTDIIANYKWGKQE